MGESLNKGICFVCGQVCERYCHFECAITYSDKREQFGREEQKKKDDRYDKILDKKLNDN